MAYKQGFEEAQQDTLKRLASYEEAVRGFGGAHLPSEAFRLARQNLEVYYSRKRTHIDG